ncbi:MAG: DUF4097 domain-containing protein [Chloroflexota bacterium]|nr:DUF4097 domain-containing protein [Chloroflexota bacterium]
MTQMTFDIGAAARVVVDRCHGDIQIEGGDRTQVEVNGDRTLENRVREAAGEVTISGYHGKLQLKVGSEATITGRRVSGDVAIQNVANVEFQSVGGDFSATRIGALQVHDVGGDLRVELRGGPVEIGRVGGDLRVDHATTLQFGAVGGDADLQNVEQLTEPGRIGGDLRLQWAGRLGGPASLSVGGDARLELAEGASFVLLAHVGGDVSGEGTTWDTAGEANAEEDQAAAEAGEQVQGWDQFGGGGKLMATFGDGGEELRLTVGGDLEIHGGRVTAASFKGVWEGDIPVGDFAGLGEEMRRFGREMRHMGRELARELTREMRTAARSGGPGGRPRVHVQFNDKAFHFDAEQIERITREAREAAASGVARAQEAVERALVNMVSGGRASYRPPMPPRPPFPGAGPRPPMGGYTGHTVRIEREEPPPAESRSPEEIRAEKLAILRMVSEGRLAIDEAEAMLRALEGRG